MHAHTPHPLQFPADAKGRDPRCAACGYRLCGLSVPSCPECGRRFDPDRPDTYSYRPPFVWQQYWWPGAVMSLGVGLAWCVVFYAAGELGWGVFTGVPFMLGALIGYRPQPGRWRVSLVARGALLAVPVLLVALMMVGGLAGLFCGIMLLGMFIPFAAVGYGCARLLAEALKHSRFPQRAYLPGVVLIMALPGIAHLFEAALATPIRPSTVQTARVLPATPQQAWDAQLFYEEVPGPRPVLHRIGLPRPIAAEGQINAVGDKHTSRYTKGGRIVKQATAVEPGERLTFDLIEQKNFEDRSIRFIRGRFDFEPVGDDATRVTLTSIYQPALRPRMLWQPIEQTIAHTLHDHVLDGMAERATQDRYTSTTGKRGTR